MKKIYQLALILFIPLAALLLAYTDGPPAGNTGSPLDGQDCTDCHPPGPATQVPNWISSTIPLEGYTPGENYTVTVTAQDIAAEKMGFQITSETASAKTGAFIITDATRTQLTTSTVVSHTSAGTAVTGVPNSWSMDWTAPVSGTGAVTFYVAVNVTNANGATSGDMIYTSSLNVPESNIGIAELYANKVGQIYPNPATDHINISLPNNAEIKVYDISGREVLSMANSTKIASINISHLDQGIYHVHILSDGVNTTRSFVKQ